MNRIKNGITFLLIAVICITVLLCMPALAAEAIDTNHPVSLNVSYEYEGRAIPNVQFYVFKVADVSENGKFTLTGDFVGFDGSVNETGSADDWNKLAVALEKYAAKKSLKPTYTGTTGPDGKLQIPGENGVMMPGLYLLSCGNIKIYNDIYTSQPSAVCLPNDGEDGGWQYDVTVNAKCGHKPIPTPTPPVVTPPQRLPQTGMLWWPVPVLLLAGLFSLAIGVYVRRRDT